MAQLVDNLPVKVDNLPVNDNVSVNFVEQNASDRSFFQQAISDQRNELLHSLPVDFRKGGRRSQNLSLQDAKWITEALFEYLSLATREGALGSSDTAILHGGKSLDASSLREISNWRDERVYRIGFELRPQNNGKNEIVYDIEIHVQSPRMINKSARKSLAELFNYIFADRVHVRFIKPVQLLDGPAWFGPSSLGIGCDIATERGRAGPITCFVHDVNSKTVHAVACGHVLADGVRNVRGRRVFSPTSFLLGEGKGSEFGTVKTWQTPEQINKQIASNCVLDVALIEINPDRVPSDTSKLNHIPGHDTIMKVARDVLPKDVNELNLTKTPAASPSRRGVVYSLNVLLEGHNSLGDIVQIREAIGLRPEDPGRAFAQSGDSGALLVDSDNRGRAMLIASDVSNTNRNEFEGRAYAYNLQTALNALDVVLV